MPRTPTMIFRDGYSIGQLAKQWERTPHYVRRLIVDGKLAVDERGVISNTALHDFYRKNPHPFDP